MAHSLLTPADIADNEATPTLLYELRLEARFLLGDIHQLATLVVRSAPNNPSPYPPPAQLTQWRARITTLRLLDPTSTL